MKKTLVQTILLSGILGCGDPQNKMVDDSALSLEYQNPDYNGDGSIQILVLGSNLSINNQKGFSPELIQSELTQIFTEDPLWSGEINIVAEDIHQSKTLSVELGSGGSLYDYTHHSHSLLQYFYWPEGITERFNNLSGNGQFDWDYVVIAPDPFIVGTTPGYFALGAHKVAERIVEGGAIPLVVATWAEDATVDDINNLVAFTQRVVEGAPVKAHTVPSGLAWSVLPDPLKDAANTHPSPNAAYLTAASIYTTITQMNATNSEYSYEPLLADKAWETVIGFQSGSQSTIVSEMVTPFSSCNVTEQELTYTHTGTSTENGILNGLNWVFDQAPETLQNGGDGPSTFNYGRANTNYESHKRYQIDPDRFQFSFGFPMQDGFQTGDETMLYGLDIRDSGVVNDTDLGVAHYMIQQSEVPYGRAIPLRTFYAQLREINPEQSAFRDSWHLHRDIDKAAAGYMYMMLTGRCSLGEEPNDDSSAEWLTWRAHKIGCDTAWTFMHLESSPF